MVKTCTKCKLIKNINLFHKNPKCIDGLDYWCRACWAEYRLEYRKLNLNKSRQYTNSKRANRIKWLQNLKQNTPCADCNKVYEPYCMDYDHDLSKGKKVKDISRMILDNSSIDSILKEIQKCQLVCLLCHNKRTINRISSIKGKARKYRNHQLRNIAIINDFKNQPCKQCGQQYEEYNMQFDHINPADKLYNICQLKSRKLEILVAELAKCQVLCALCHRKKSIIEQQNKIYTIIRTKPIKKDKLFYNVEKNIKECSLCHVVKAGNLFRKNKKMTCGLDSYCKDCFNKYKKERRKAIKIH